MEANNDTPAGEKKRTVTDESGLGAVQEATGQVGGVFARAEVADPVTDDAEITVQGCAYDDRDGQVQLSVGGGVSLSVVVSSDEARELADAIATAAEEADREVEVE
jgi:phage tail sheath gpL-like